MTLELTIGPMIKKVEFQVLNIASCFNMLLRQPWIHDIEAVPLSLYQKVQFPHEGAIVTIYCDTLTILMPIFGIDSEKEPLTLDGFEIEKPSFERRQEEVEKILMDFAPCNNNKRGGNDEKNELPSEDELKEDNEEAKCSSPNNSYCHTTFWARL